MRAQGDLQVVSTVNSGNVTAEVLNLAAGNAQLRGSGKLSASAGGAQLYAQDQTIFLRGPGRPIVRGANDGEVIVNYGFQNLSREAGARGLEELERGPGTGPVGEALCGKLVDEELGRELVTLDYNRLRCVLVGSPGAPGRLKRS